MCKVCCSAAAMELAWVIFPIPKDARVAKQANITIKRIAQVTEKLVPIMGVIYVTLGVITIVMNAGKLPAAFAVIFQEQYCTDCNTCGTKNTYRVLERCDGQCSAV